MTTEQQLRQLEARVDDLLRISARLRQENQSLHEREAKLVEERAQLLKKKRCGSQQGRSHYFSSEIPGAGVLSVASCLTLIHSQCGALGHV